MKTSKSPENADLTPSKKKLKQATLPFKPKNEVSPAPVAPVTRKRKLSGSDDVSKTKIGKIAKENGVVEDAVVISDEDSKDSVKSQKDTKTPNPFVKLVDTAWKKKLQKGRKKKGDKKKVPKNETVVAETAESADFKELDSEMMDVDEPAEVCNEDNVNSNENHHTEGDISKKTNGKSETSDIVVLEDSNSADDDITSKEPTSKEVISQNPEITNEDSSDKDQESENPTSETTTETNETQVTPKRSTRNKVKSEPNNNSKGSPTALNDSVQSTPRTPKQTPKTSRSSSVTNSQGDVSINESTPSANLTPKQVQKKLESAKKKEEREKEKIEREKKRQQEKEERAKQRQEKEDQKKKEREEKEEAKRKEKEEKEELKKKEKEEKEKLKELEKKCKEEKEELKKKEKEEKEEQRKKEKEARDEEKRKKQEALELEKQEQELKKKKAAEAFVNFFVPKQKTEKETITSCLSKTNLLSNFAIKSDMRLAPLVRNDLSDDRKEDLVKYIEKQGVDKDCLYLKSLKKVKPLSSGKTWPYTADDDDVMVIEDELPDEGTEEILNCEPNLREKLRPKLLSFHENRRPPYWGTWRKKSNAVKPRKPFAQDEKLLDYEVDSDDDWEEEQEGESIDGSAAGSDDEQDGDEYEVDNVVFVPHGYLSDEEATMDEDDVLSLSPEAQKAKLKHLEDEFESEMKKPTEKLKPRLYGLLWETENGGKPENCVDALWNYFGKLSMIMNDVAPLLQPAPQSEEVEKKKVKKKRPATDSEKSPKPDKKKKAKIVENEGKSPKVEVKKNVPETKKNQPGINMFLKKVNT